MDYFSLFSGIGGFELGLGEKHRCVGYSEIDKYAIRVYESHFPTHKNYGDITKIDERGLPDFELLCGGFPCQSFSIAGKRGGFEDTRGTLFFHIARIAKHKRPRLLFLENVKGLLSHDAGRTFNTIIATLDELGYDVQWQVLNSKNHGVPQNRERVFIVGHLRGTPRPKVFPFGNNGEADHELQGHYANTLTTRYYDEQGTGAYIAESKFAPQKIKQINRPKHATDRVYDEGGVAPTLDTAQGGQRQPKIRVTNDGFHLARQDAKASSIQGTHVTFADGKSHALSTAHIPMTGDEMKIRRLTPIECERLQGFPDNWTDMVSASQRYKCLGNAVTVNVIRDIAVFL